MRLSRGLGFTPRTANKDLSVLSGLWKHAERRAMVNENPWRGQALPEVSSGVRGAHKRPLTDSEVAKLLTATPGPLLGDAMTILALSGMRDRGSGAHEGG